MKSSSIFLPVAVAAVLVIASVQGFAVSSMPAYAQEHPEPHAPQATNADNAQRTPEQIVERLAIKLNLTDDQKAKITPIIAERQQKMQELRADTSMRRMKKMRKMKSAVDDSDKKINKILDKEQKAKYEQLKKEMRQQAQERRNSQR